MPLIPALMPEFCTPPRRTDEFLRVTPLGWDYGDVTLGNPETIVFTLESLGPTPLMGTNGPLTPDTLVTLTTGRKIMVLEELDEVIRRAVAGRHPSRPGQGS